MSKNDAKAKSNALLSHINGYQTQNKVTTLFQKTTQIFLLSDFSGLYCYKKHFR